MILKLGILIDATAEVPQFVTLKAECTEQNVQLNRQEMSPSTSISMGSNALTSGFIAKPHGPDLLSDFECNF